MKDYITTLQIVRKKEQRKGEVIAQGRQSREEKPERVESVKEWYKTNKALFSMRGAMCCADGGDSSPFAQWRVWVR